MRLRLLPVLIVAAGLTLTARVGDLWHGNDRSGGAAAEVMAADDPAVADPAVENQAEEDWATASDLLQAEQIESSITPRAGTEAPAAANDGAMAAPADQGEEDTGGLSADPFELTDTEIDLLQKLAERRAEIEREALDLEEQRLLLQAAESRVDQKLEELKTLQVMIQDLLALHEQQEEKQFGSLVKIYESMKPKDAARIFEQLDMVVLLEVISRMKERKTAPVLAMMDPEKAKAVTLELANRQTLPIPKE